MYRTNNNNHIVEVLLLIIDRKTDEELHSEVVEIRFKDTRSIHHYGNTVEYNQDFVLSNVIIQKAMWIINSFENDFVKSPTKLFYNYLDNRFTRTDAFVVETKVGISERDFKTHCSKDVLNAGIIFQGVYDPTR